MKKTILLITAVCSLGLTTAWGAPPKPPKCNSEQAVKAADQLWANTIATHDPSKVANLYAEDAVLLGTFENVPLLTYEQRYDYFKQLFQKIPNLKVKYDQVHIKLLKKDAISSGLYTFYGNTPDGKYTSTAARYTFAYDSTADGCKLVMHHSSVLPVEYQNIDQIQ